MKTAKLEVGFDLAGRMLYVAFMLCLIWLLIPSGRQAARAWMSQAIYVYRVQRWGEEFARRPAWEREALRVRGRAPAPERSAARVPDAYLELQHGPGGPE